MAAASDAGEGQSRASTANTWEVSFGSIPGDSGGVAYTVANGEPYFMGVVSASDWADKPESTFTVGPWTGPIRKWLLGHNIFVSETGCVGMRPFRGVIGGRKPACPVFLTTAARLVNSSAWR